LQAEQSSGPDAMQNVAGAHAPGTFKKERKNERFQSRLQEPKFVSKKESF